MGDVRLILNANHLLSDKIFSAISQTAVLNKHFPMLIKDGIPDTGLNIHSHFLTFFTSIGQHLGFSAVTECPVIWPNEAAKFGDIRADSIWFDPHSLNPQVVVEFERFERGDENKLRQKIENLALATQAYPSLKLALLVYWVRTGNAPHSMDKIVECYNSGFRRHGYKARPARTPLMIVKCVMRENIDNDKLLFSEFLRDKRNERLVHRSI